MNANKKLILTIILIVAGNILWRIDAIEQFIVLNIIELLQGVLIVYVLYRFVRSLKTTGNMTKLIALASLIFPFCILLKILPEIEKKILVIYPVIVITLIQLFGEYVGLRKIKPDSQDTPIQ